MKKRSQEQGQQLFVQVMERLSIQGDPYETIPDILKAACRFFRFGFGFIYETNHKDSLNLRETYGYYDPDELPSAIDIKSALTPTEIQELVDLGTVVIKAGQVKPGLLTTLHQMFDCQLLVLVPIINNEGGLIGLVGMSDRRGDITLSSSDFEVALCVLGMMGNQVKLRIYHDTILRMAEYDDLTGLPNRRKLTQDLEKTLARKKQGYLLFLDLDGFKRVNDDLGHQTGDNLLLLVSKMLQSNPLTAGHCYRPGGDEFVLLYDDISVERLFESIDFLQKEFREPWNLPAGTVHCSASIGIANYPHDGQDVMDLLHAADLAMYTSKPLGRAKVHFYDQGALSDANKWYKRWLAKNDKGSG